jgi:transposase-like protein
VDADVERGLGRKSERLRWVAGIAVKHGVQAISLWRQWARSEGGPSPGVRSRRPARLSLCRKCRRSSHLRCSRTSVPPDRRRVRRQMGTVHRGNTRLHEWALRMESKPRTRSCRYLRRLSAAHAVVLLRSAISTTPPSPLASASSAMKNMTSMIVSAVALIAAETSGFQSTRRLRSPGSVCTAAPSRQCSRQGPA